MVLLINMYTHNKFTGFSKIYYVSSLLLGLASYVKPNDIIIRSRTIYKKNCMLILN